LAKASTAWILLYSLASGELMNRKILILTGDGGECYETLYAYHRFQEADMTPVLAAPSKRLLNLVMHDFEPGWDTYVERPGYRMMADIALGDAKVKDYDAVLLIGGRAPEYMRNDPKCKALIRDFHNEGKWIFAICHGIQLATAAGIVKGRKVTCYEHVRFEVEVCGGTFIEQSAVRDGNFVSAQTWQDHPGFFKYVFECLNSGTPAAAKQPAAALV
jgi:protease I